MTEFRVCITFESDWHIGEGSGQSGHIDRLVRRDPSDGLPYVPAKSLTGIWRDACEQVAAGLDGRNEGLWSEWVKALFGGIDFVPEKEPADRVRRRDRPRSAVLAIGPGRFSEALRCRFGTPNYASLRVALTFVKPGVSLNEYGIAREDHLRMEEVACAGAVLESGAELSALDDAGRETALALLWAGARLTERIGGKRRRGYGRCRLELRGADLPDETRLLEILAADPAQPMPSIPNVEPRRFAAKPVSTDDEQAWHVIRLDLELLSPVVVFDGALGNVVESRDHIPGTYLLAVLNGKLKGLIGDGAFPAIARGDVRLRNAYPLLEDERALPIPLAFHYAKEDGGLDKNGGNAYNLLAKNEHGNSQSKQHRQGYVAAALVDKQLPFCEIKLQATTHGTIDDERQRPTPRVGGVYTFEAIRAGTKLRSELWIRKTLRIEPSDAEITGLNGSYRIGTAKKSDYGLVSLSATRGETPSDPQPATDVLTLWLASPLLLRNECLRPTTDPEVLRQELERRLGVRLTLEQFGCFLRVERCEGWRSGWGLPRPSLVGLAAGSCFRFKVEDTLEQGKLAALQLDGLGERRSEGFGEIRINPPLLAIEHFEAGAYKDANKGNGKTTSEAGKDRDHQASVGEARSGSEITAESLPFLHDLTRRAWRAGIRNKALALASESESRRQRFGWQDNRQSPEPSNSQLGALRSLLEGLTSESGQGMLRAWFEHLQQTPRRWEKWPAPAQRVLEGLVDDPGQVWEWLGVDAGFPEVPGLDRNSLKRDLLWEAVRAVWLAAIHSEFREREEA